MIENKRILITQPAIRTINGSTIVTLELAKELLNHGAKVTVYTCDYAEPAKSLFKNLDITLDEANFRPDYQLSDFDYIWVHSQILPTSIITSLSKKSHQKTPSFIFLHMSGMDWIPDEKPWIYNLENQLSSLSLFICEEVKKVNEPFLNPKIPTGYFRNPAPTIFKNRSTPPADQLKKMLIVSSHPPKEVIEAKNILQTNHHIQIDVLGEGQQKYELFTKGLLEQYDAVLTIAKTVPYCLISGTPVYVYDSYGGGPGWLTETNFKNAKQRNFSGYQNSQYPNYEGGVFHQKTTDQIISEILNGYQNSLKYHQKNISKFNSEFSIDQVLPQIFTDIKPRKTPIFSTDYFESVIAAQTFAKDKFIIGGSLYEKDSTIRSLMKENLALQEQNHQLLKFKQTTESSKSYRLTNKILQPYRNLRKKHNS